MRELFTIIDNLVTDNDASQKQAHQLFWTVCKEITATAQQRAKEEYAQAITQFPEPKVSWDKTPWLYNSILRKHIIEILFPIVIAQNLSEIACEDYYRVIRAFNPNTVYAEDISFADEAVFQVKQALLIMLLPKERIAVRARKQNSSLPYTTRSAYLEQLCLDNALVVGTIEAIKEGIDVRKERDSFLTAILKYQKTLNEQVEDILRKMGKVSRSFYMEFFGSQSYMLGSGLAQIVALRGSRFDEIERLRAKNPALDLAIAKYSALETLENSLMDSEMSMTYRVAFVKSQINTRITEGVNYYNDPQYKPYLGDLLRAGDDADGLALLEVINSQNNSAISIECKNYKENRVKLNRLLKAYPNHVLSRYLTVVNDAVVAIGGVDGRNVDPVKLNDLNTALSTSINAMELPATARREREINIREMTALAERIEYRVSAPWRMLRKGLIIGALASIVVLGILAAIPSGGGSVLLTMGALILTSKLFIGVSAAAIGAGASAVGAARFFVNRKERQFADSLVELKNQALENVDSANQPNGIASSILL